MIDKNYTAPGWRKKIDKKLTNKALIGLLVQTINDDVGQIGHHDNVNLKLKEKGWINHDQHNDDLPKIEEH